MILGTHYYVLSLSTGSAVLYEAFRDALIRIEDQGFPVIPSTTGASDHSPRDLMRIADGYFDFYDSSQPLGLIVVGDEQCQSDFDAVTTHASTVVGRVKCGRGELGDSDLGRIVWLAAKEVISAARDRAMRDMEACAGRGRLVSGLQAVLVVAAAGTRGMLLVEEEFRFRGSLVLASQPPFVSRDVDIRDVNDDVVDALIEQVLRSGGNVVFMHDGVLADQGRIALLPEEGRDP
jgi:hypothetical protein